MKLNTRVFIAFALIFILSVSDINCLNSKAKRNRRSNSKISLKSKRTKAAIPFKDINIILLLSSFLGASGIPIVSDAGFVAELVSPTKTVTIQFEGKDAKCSMSEFVKHFKNKVDALYDEAIEKNSSAAEKLDRQKTHKACEEEQVKIDERRKLVYTACRAAGIASDDPSLWNDIERPLEDAYNNWKKSRPNDPQITRAGYNEFRENYPVCMAEYDELLVDKEADCKQMGEKTKLGKFWYYLPGAWNTVKLIMKCNKKTALEAALELTIDVVLNLLLDFLTGGLSKIIKLAVIGFRLFRLIIQYFLTKKGENDKKSSIIGKIIGTMVFMGLIASSLPHVSVFASAFLNGRKKMRLRKLKN